MKIFKTSLTGELKEGDLIHIDGWHATLGIFLGAGSGDSMQFYTIHYLSKWLNKKGKLYKDYIHFREWKVIKVDARYLKGDILNILNDAIEAARILNIKINL